LRLITSDTPEFSEVGDTGFRDGRTTIRPGDALNQTTRRLQSMPDAHRGPPADDGGSIVDAAGVPGMRIVADPLQ
jgi:hypothetical protein